MVKVWAMQENGCCTFKLQDSVPKFIFYGKFAVPDCFQIPGVFWDLPHLVSEMTYVNHNRIGIHDGAVPDMLIELFFVKTRPALHRNSFIKTFSLDERNRLSLKSSIVILL